MTIQYDVPLGQWAEDARLFASRPSEDNEAALTLIVCDFEYSYDRDRHAGYLVAEGKAAERRIRWPFHRIAAASWLVLRFTPGKTIPIFEEPVVMTGEGSTEKQMVESFFDACRAEPDAILTTWGGEAKDMAVLRAAAMMHGFVVPSQLTDLHPHSRHRIDLCQATSVAAASVHLPEFAAALGIPSKPTASANIGPAVDNGDWALVAEQVLADVVTTTVIALWQLAASGQVTIDRATTLLTLSERLNRHLASSAFCTRIFAPWVRARRAEAGLRGTVFRAPTTMPEAVRGHSTKQSEGEIA